MKAAEYVAVPQNQSRSGHCKQPVAARITRGDVIMLPQLTLRLVALATTFCAGSVFASEVDEPAADDGLIPPSYQLGEGVALIELFTSEGCSSCPPAEKMVQGLVNEALAEGHDIHLLSWHVDYWNELNTPHGVWVDPYSDPQYTQRQRAYALGFVQMGLSERPVMVTPQVLLNGLPYQVVPGEAAGSKLQAVASASTKDTTTIDATVTRDGAALSVEWSVTPGSDDWQPNGSLTIAAVESGVHSSITAGENHGHSTVHDHLVRTATMDKLEGTAGTTVLTLPDNWQGQSGAVLLVIQNGAFQVVDVARSCDSRANCGGG